MTLWRARADRFFEPAATFLLLASVFGLLFTFVIPPFQGSVPGSDESFHFFRSYQVSTGQLIGSKLDERSIGGYIPSSIVEFEHAADKPAVATPTHRYLAPWLNPVYARQPLNPDKTEAHAFTSATYSPLVYMPQALAMAVLRSFSAAPIFLLYAGRLAGLIAWVAFTWLAIRLMPFGKWFFALLALLPVTIDEATSLGADSLTNALVMFSIALFIRYANDKGRSVNWFRPWQLVVLGAALGLIKIPYGLVIVLLFPAVIQREQGKRHFDRVALSAVLAAGATMMLWIFVSMRLYVDPVAGNSIAQHPLQFVAAFFRTYLASQSDSIVLTFVQAMTWGAFPFPVWIVVAFFMLLSVAWFYGGSDGEHIRWLVRYRVCAIAVAGILVLLVSAVFYATWTQQGVRWIDGLQGRYFLLPVALIGLAVGGVVRLDVANSRRVSRFLALGTFALLIATTGLLFVGYHAFLRSA